MKNASSNCLEEQLDSYVLGQVGSELFAEAPDSAMFPCSLGMILIETTVSLNVKVLWGNIGYNYQKHFFNRFRLLAMNTWLKDYVMDVIALFKTIKKLSIYF